MRPASLPRASLQVLCLLLLAGCGSDTSDPGPNPPPAPPSPPIDLYALPGPALDRLTLAAAPSSGATSYTIYRGSAPGVTPGPATKIGSNNSPGLVDGPLAAGTYYYVMTASNDAGESAASTETSIVFAPGFSIVVSSPQPLGLSGDHLDVSLTITSTFELSTVSADVGGRSAVLTFVGTPGQGRWRGTIDLTGLPHGPLRMSLAAADVQANAIETSVPFLYNTSPVLTVVAPINYEVARPSVHVTGSCADDTNGCAAIVIDFVDETLRPVQRLFEGSGAALDFDLSLASLGVGGEPLLRFLATDASGQADTVFRRVSTEAPDASLQVAATVPGRVLDADADRILFVDSTSADAQVVKLRDRAAGTDVTISSGTAAVLGRAYLTPVGAVFLRERSGFPFSTLFEWRNAVLTDLGGALDLRVGGSFAAYGTGASAVSTTLLRRNTVTGDVVTVATGVSITGRDVAANGDVAYWTDDGSVWRFRHGSGAAQISPATGLNAYPLTDGVNVVYQRRTAMTPAGIGTYEIELFDGTSTTTVAPGREQDVISAGSDYAVDNGWTAYTKAGSGGQLQVWTRSPAGDEQQVTFFGSPSSIAALGPNGEVVSKLAGSGFRYSAPPSAGAADLGAGSATAFVFVGGSLLKLVGNTVFVATP